MNKWIAEFDLEDGDKMPEHMDLEYKGAKLDFRCRPKEPILDKIRAEITGMYRVILKGTPEDDWAVRWNDCIDEVLQKIDKYRQEGI